ncbi:hypothetical protein [Streptomyces tateyamensis]|nr:hypothetical protein [Streptomyces tateyamensis]
MTQDAALAAARRHAENPAGGKLSPALASGLPAVAVKMTISQFDQLQHIGADNDIAPDRSVWVVTVHGSMTTDALPGRPPVTDNVYTDVIDAATGTLVIEAIGVEAVK